VIIEVPSGSQNKIEYDVDKESFVVNRVLSTKLSFPFNYGFIPETWSTDDDPLDAVVISSGSIPTGSQIKTRVVGLLSTTDQDGPDSKIITVPISEKDPVISKINNIDALDKQTNKDIQYFYKNYKLNEPGKWVDINGFLTKEEAETVLSESIDRYHQHFQK
jgi:inorganic pyrophosphatase